MIDDKLLEQFFPLLPGRAHEACGAGRYAFAAMLAAQMGGEVIWIKSRWQADQIHPLGLNIIYDPARIIMVKCKGQFEILGAAEDALRSGAVSLVIAELPEEIDFRQGRRLQLAAREGNIPGLFLIQQDGGCNAAHTRWLCQPKFDPIDSTSQSWSLIKNKSGTLYSWDVRWYAKARRVTVVSETGKRPVSKA